MVDEDAVFAIFLYKGYNKNGQFVVADDPYNSNEPYYDYDPSPDYIIDRAREMIFRTFVHEFKERGHHGLVQSIEAMQKAADSTEAMLVQLPRSAEMAQRLDDDVGFMMSQVFMPGGDGNDGLCVKALVVKANQNYSLEATQQRLLPAVNRSEEL